MALANVNLKFGVNLESFRSGMQKVEKEMSRVGTKMQSIGKGLTLGLTLPIVALGAASVKAASDAEETFSKFDTVFKKVAGSADESFKILRNEYGLSSRASKQLLADTGDLLTGFGFAQPEALRLSTEVSKLAVDLASFTNFSGGAEGASKALTAALLGEREGVKALGIAILEEDVKKQVLLNTSKGLVFETERQAKAQATLDIAMAQSKNAIGDYARTQEGFANQSRLLKARLEDISSELGKVMLPIMTIIVGTITSVVGWFSNLSDTTKTVIVVVAGLAAAIGPLLLGLGYLMTTVLPMIKAGFIAVSAAMTPLVLKIGAVIAIVGGLILVGKAVYDSWDTVKVFFGQMWEKIKLLFIKGVASTLAVFNKFTSAIGLDFSDTVEDLQKTAKGIESALATQPVISFGDVMSAIGGNIMKTFTSVKDAVSSATDEVAEGNKELAKTAALGGGAGSAKLNRTKDSGIAGPAKDLSLKLPAGMAGISDRLKGETAGMMDTMNQFNSDINSLIGGSITSAFTNLGASIGAAIGSGGNVIAEVGKSLLQSLGGFLGELGKMMVSYGLMAIAKASLDASMLVPGAGFVTGPMAVAAGIALIALSGAIGAFASGKSKSKSGGGPLGGPSSVGARAMGGSVQMGSPYLVGERGPELFTPSGFGSISNNKNTMGGGMAQSIKVIVEGVLSGRDIHLSGQEYVRVSGRST